MKSINTENNGREIPLRNPPGSQSSTIALVIIILLTALECNESLNIIDCRWFPVFLLLCIILKKGFNLSHIRLGLTRCSWMNISSGRALASVVFGWLRGLALFISHRDAGFKETSIINFSNMTNYGTKGTTLRINQSVQLCIKGVLTRTDDDFGIGKYSHGR